MDSGHHQKAAHRFRELKGTAGLEQTLGRAVGALSHAEISHVVTGGYAAQEYGCLRYTNNVDLIVPNIVRPFAVLLESGFQPHRSSRNNVVDPETGFEVRLYEGGSIPKKD
jgi:hypothetical protein